MKGLILTLLIIPSFLFAQEQEVEPKVTIAEFDNRCFSPVTWSASLIDARRSGTTQSEVVKRMRNDYTSGPLASYHPETLLYMLEIVDVVFLTETVETDQEILDVLRVVETLCIMFIEKHTQPNVSPKKDLITT